MKIWFGPGRYSRRQRESTGLSPFGIAASARRRASVQGRVDAQEQGDAREHVTVTRTEVPSDIGDRLGVRRNSEVIRVETVHLADGGPVQYSVTYVPAGIADEAAFENGNIYAHLEELGWPVTLIREEITARMPTPEEMTLLGLDEGIPVIEMLHTSLDDWKRPFEVTRFVIRADRAGLTYEVPIED